MATNDFLPFATDSGAAVDSQAVWASPSGYRPGGYTSGILTKEKLNKALRQSSQIASAVAQLMSDALNEDVLDDGDMAALVDQLQRAVPTLPTFAAQGDQLNGMTQPFTGAVLRTQRAKNAEFVSVKDFGAVGDGNADDTAALQAAHNASMHVHYPDGYYKVFAPINARDGTYIEGASPGRTVVVQGGNFPGELDAVFQLKIPAASFDSRQAGITVRNISVIGDNQFGHGFLLQNVRFPIFDNVWVNNFNGSALVCDYAEEGYFQFMNINNCGRTGGNANVTADTLYGQITLHRSAGAVPGVSNNFLRFYGLTLANAKCSGDILVKAGSPSRIYFTETQSENSGAAIGNRDWLAGNNMGGIFWFVNNDVVNYRNCFDKVHFMEIYAADNRVTNSTKYYVGANGTGSYTGNGNRTNGAIDYTSVSSFDATNDAYGDANFQFLFNVSLVGCKLNSLTINDISATPSLNVMASRISGNLSMSNFAYNGIVAFNQIGGSATLAGCLSYGNQVTGARTENTATVSVPTKSIANATAASAMTLPVNSDMIFVNGTTAISSITNPLPFAGRTVTLIFNAAVTVNKANNLLIASTFAATADDTLTLISDGTNFREVSRSVV